MKSVYCWIHRFFFFSGTYIFSPVLASRFEFDLVPHLYARSKLTRRVAVKQTSKSKERYEWSKTCTDIEFVIYEEMQIYPLKSANTPLVLSTEAQ